MKKLLISLVITALLLSTTTVSSNDSLSSTFNEATYNHEIIVDNTGINLLNESIILSNSTVFNLLTLETDYNTSSIIGYIEALSTKPLNNRYDAKRNLISDKFYTNQNNNININAYNNTISYGIAIERTQLRKYPSTEVAYSSTTSPYDRFLETTIYTGEPLAILHESADGLYSFVCMYNYMGWVKSKDIARCDSNILKMYMECKNFITITSANTLSINSQMQLDLGSTFPLLTVDRNYNLVALLPGKNADGTLYFIKDSINRIDSYKGYLPYTTENIVNTALKLIDEPYGWGGDNNARDCSSFVMDVYRTVGINLPRNTSDQEKVPGKTTLLKSIDDYKSLEIGTLLFMDGHVMMYLGEYNNISYMLHDTPGYYQNKQFVYANGVTISPITIYNSSGISYDQLISHAIFLQ